MRFHNAGGLRLQDRTEVIADELVGVANAVAARQVCDRAWTRNRRLEVGPCEVRPYAREGGGGSGFSAWRRRGQQHHRDQRSDQPLLRRLSAIRSSDPIIKHRKGVTPFFPRAPRLTHIVHGVLAIVPSHLEQNFSLSVYQWTVVSTSQRLR